MVADGVLHQLVHLLASIRKMLGDFDAEIPAVEILRAVRRCML